MTGACATGRNRSAFLGAAGDPFFEVGKFGADGGAFTVAGVHDGVARQSKKLRADTVDNCGEVTRTGSGRAGAAAKQRVAGKDPTGRGKAATAGRVARVVARPKKKDSAEVQIGEEFIAVLFLEDGERSFAFQMAILDTDLE